MQDYKAKLASRTWYAYKRVSKLSPLINHTQMFVPNHSTNGGPATVWLQVFYMHLLCAHVLPWSVCARSAQHWVPAASHTRAGHKGHSPYTSPNRWVVWVIALILEIVASMLYSITLVWLGPFFACIWVCTQHFLYSLITSFAPAFILYKLKLVFLLEHTVSLVFYGSI